jgi:DNA polymerase III delta subunit
MAAENALGFIRAIGLERGIAAPVFLIAGQQSFLREYVLDALRHRLSRDGFNYRAFQVGGSSGFGPIIDELEGADLFAPKRLVACRVLKSHRGRSAEEDDGGDSDEDARSGGGADEAALAEIIERVGGATRLAVVYERDNAPAKMRRAVEKTGVVVNCPRPYDNQIAQYAEAFARTLGLKLGVDAADLLAVRHGSDLGEIANELSKAAIRCGEKGRVEVSDLSERGASRVPDIFEIAECVARGSTGEALGLLDRAIQTGRDPIEILGVEMIPLVRRMLIAASLIAKRKGIGEISRALGLQPASPLLTRAVDGARRMGFERIARAHLRLCELDAQFKTGMIRERDQALAAMIIELMAEP